VNSRPNVQLIARQKKKKPPQGGELDQQVQVARPICRTHHRFRLGAEPKTQLPGELEVFVETDQQRTIPGIIRNPRAVT